MNTKILYTIWGLLALCNLLVAKDMPQKTLIISSLGTTTYSGQQIPTMPGVARQPNVKQVTRGLNTIPQRVITKIQSTRQTIKTQRGRSNWYDFHHIVLYMIIAVGILCLVFVLADLKNYLAIPIVLLGVLIAIYLLQLMHLLR